MGGAGFLAAGAAARLLLLSLTFCPPPPPQATSLPRERVSEFRSEAAKYLAAQRGTQHMSGAAGVSAYQTVPAGPPPHAMHGGAALPPAGSYPYGSSVDMEGAVELVRGRGRAAAVLVSIAHLGQADWAGGTAERHVARGDQHGNARLAPPANLALPCCAPSLPCSWARPWRR